MIDAALVWLAFLALLLVVLVGLVRQAVKCPRCGSLRFQSFPPTRVRQCSDCNEMYEVVDS